MSLLSLSLLLAMLSSEAPAQTVLKKCKLSKLDTLPANLVDEEVVKPGEVKVGSNRFIKLSMIKEVEKNVVYLTARIETLAHVFYSTDIHKYSVKTTGTHVVEENELASILQILLHMKWQYRCEVTAKKIRTRIIKFLSECRIKHEKMKQDKKSKKFSKRSSRKRPKTDTSESDDEVKAKKSKTTASESDDEGDGSRGMKKPSSDSDSSESDDDVMTKEIGKQTHVNKSSTSDSESSESDTSSLDDTSSSKGTSTPASEDEADGTPSPDGSADSD
ncbi:suppressor protein SRP40-like [Thrips palmi]|uniref:Suppressor protein SRP40-like n=1 Tax=Thrips palmi TaxID=161013 RepID=A0A6P9AH90_THRPL|nr:suppressor protein SRP40-like [Thrips palmi]